MKRYQINVFVAGTDFPVATYVTDSSEAASTCIVNLLANSNAGFSRVEILDSTQALPLLAMAPQDLD